jgi:hypothetical protein
MARKKQSPTEIVTPQEPGPQADDRELRIRELAYALWERAGRPDGPPMEFWLAAEQALAEGDVKDDTRSS